MCDALENLRSICQRAEEDYDSYNKRLGDSIHLCGNDHEEDQEMIFYIDGILHTARPIVARFRASQPRRELTFKDLTLCKSRSCSCTYRCAAVQAFAQ